MRTLIYIKLFTYFLLNTLPFELKTYFCLTLNLFYKQTRVMNNMKNKFSIKDLENLTGIKAHTIRIWEKRYSLLSPKRTDY